jgi:hypothetical protein
MFAEQPFPSLNDPTGIIGFLIFAIDWRIAAALVGNHQELRAVLNALLVADAAQHRVPLHKVDISTRNNDRDAGIDALVEFPDGVKHDWLEVGENVLQYKAGKLTKALLLAEFNKPGVQRALKKGGHYRRRLSKGRALARRAYAIPVSCSQLAQRVLRAGGGG